MTGDEVRCPVCNASPGEDCRGFEYLSGNGGRFTHGARENHAQLETRFVAMEARIRALEET